MGAIVAWRAHRPSLTLDDIAERAERAVRMLVANGVTAVRTHVDVAADIGTLGVEALREGPRGGRPPGRPADRGPRQPADQRPRRQSGTGRRWPRRWRPAPTSSAGARTSKPTRAPPWPTCSRSPRRRAGTVDLHTDETLDPACSTWPRWPPWCDRLPAPGHGQPLRAASGCSRPRCRPRSPRRSPPPASPSSRSRRPTCSSRRAAGHGRQPPRA